MLRIWIEHADRWNCVHFLGREGANAVVQQDTSAGLLVVEIDALVLAEDALLFNALAMQLEFPDYFGENWDALYECLSDLRWLTFSSLVLTINGSEDLPMTRALGKLIEVWLAAAQEWSKAGRPFHLVIIGDWSEE